MRLRRPVFAAFALVLVACTDSSGESTTTPASTGEASTGEASTGASTGAVHRINLCKPVDLEGNSETLSIGGLAIGACQCLNPVEAPEEAHGMRNPWSV